MKTTTLLCHGPAAVLATVLAAMQPAAAQNENITRGVDVKGADVKGADVKGADVRGVTVTGGSVTGGSVTGGSVTGGSVTGGSITPGTVTPGLVTAFAADREIRVRSIDPVTVDTQGATAEVKIGGQRLVIEKTKVLLDGEALADLPADTQTVDVEVTDGRLQVNADGERLAQKPLDRRHRDTPGSEASDSDRADPADSARQKAERARSEGDRTRQEAERIRQEADRLRQQADRLRDS